MIINKTTPVKLFNKFTKNNSKTIPKSQTNPTSLVSVKSDTVSFSNKNLVNKKSFCGSVALFLGNLIKSVKNSINKTNTSDLLKTKEDLEKEISELRSVLAEETLILRDVKLYELVQKNHYHRLLNTIKEQKLVSVATDKLMAQKRFGKKLKKFLNTRITMVRNHYDCDKTKLSLNELFSSSVKGEYSCAQKNIYHGTNRYSYQDILNNGFTLDACKFAESGKGIYFGFSKDTIRDYGTSIVEAIYKGRKIAFVEAGVMKNVGDRGPVNELFRRIFKINNIEKSKIFANELISRVYNKQMKSKGYDALFSYSESAGCQYMVVLDPKDIEIIKPKINTNLQK